MKCKLRYHGMSQTYSCEICGTVYSEMDMLKNKNPECEDKTLTHLMVDIETLGNGPRSVITQIGACYFDPETGSIGQTFEVNINIQSCLDIGLEIDGDTIKWWFGQESRTWLNNTVPLILALRQFGQFCHKAKHVWSHATFDMPILFNAYRECDEKIPFHYRTPRDIRTLVWLWGGKFEREPRVGAHDGLSDCKYQVEYVTKCYKEIQDERNT